MRFSQRIGRKPIKNTIQIESMDNDLRTALWNCFHLCFLDKFEGPSDADLLLINMKSSSSTRHFNLGEFEDFFRILWHDFLKLPLGDLENNFNRVISVLKERFFNCPWYEAYDFIEYASQVNSPADSSEFRRLCNQAMERELSGYRFVGTQITSITDEVELKEVEEALETSKKSKLPGVYSHLESALEKLSDRKNPDYRNSIKESISAVEAVSQVILGNSKAELGQTLKLIENNIGLHPALKKGFLAIYGYTSDADGIRHAMINESGCDFEDAKYMLVSCSAFINYLIMKTTKAGITI